MTELQPSSQVYIVRIWQVPADEQSWRGVIQNVRTGQSVSASDLNQLMDLIHRCFHEDKKNKQKEVGGLK